MLNGAEIAAEVRKAALNGHDIDMAVAFWGHDAVELLGLAEATGRIRAICNLSLGGTAPEPIRALRDDIRNASVSQLHNLHAKVFRLKDSVIVGSANASANGFGLEGAEQRGWIEAGVRITAPSELRAVDKWFRELWREARQVSDRDLQAARRARQRLRAPLPNDMRADRTLHSDRRPMLLEAVRRNDPSLQPFHIALYLGCDLADEAEQAWLKAAEERGADPEVLQCYQDWEDLLPTAWVLDIAFDTHKRRNGHPEVSLWRVDQNPYVKYGERAEDSITLCWKADNIFPWQLPPQDKKTIQRAYAALREHMEQNGTGGSLLLNARELAGLLR